MKWCDALFMKAKLPATSLALSREMKLAPPPPRRSRCLQTGQTIHHTCISLNTTVFSDFYVEFELSAHVHAAEPPDSR